jgi:hypothetical protein
VPQEEVLVLVQVQVLQEEGEQVVVGKRKMRGQDRNISLRMLPLPSCWKMDIVVI